MNGRTTLFVLLFTLLMGCQRDPLARLATAKPTLLGKNSLSRNSMQWNNAYVPRDREIYYTVSDSGGTGIYSARWIEGTFERSGRLPFPGNDQSSDVFVNSRNDLLLFTSFRPEFEGDGIRDWNLWKSVRTDDTWGSAELLFEINPGGNQFHPTMARNGALYFSSAAEGSSHTDIYLTEPKDGVYRVAHPLPAHINTPGLEGDPFIAPDESYLIFAGTDRPDSMGKTDLYITFFTGGRWTDPVSLGEDINSQGYDNSPFVPEGTDYLLFTSSRGSSEENTYFNHYIVRFDPDDFRK